MLLLPLISHIELNSFQPWIEIFRPLRSVPRNIHVCTNYEAKPSWGSKGQGTDATVDGF
jgi:hypothetical protein